MVDPPWNDDEWNYRSHETQTAGKGQTLFTSWPKLAPIILDFIENSG
jgi:hypothetical protein